MLNPLDATLTKRGEGEGTRENANIFWPRRKRRQAAALQKGTLSFFSWVAVK